jgi:nucleoid-associated protein YgaU
MANLEELKQKYAPVLETMQQFAPLGASVEEVTLSGDKLLLKGTVPSTVVANRVWDVIKSVDPTYSDLQHQISTTGGADQDYTVASGDNLSRISKLFYGSANKYEKIAQANNMDDPDKIKAGQTIRIPVLS